MQNSIRIHWELPEIYQFNYITCGQVIGTWAVCRDATDCFDIFQFLGEVFIMGVSNGMGMHIMGF